MTNPIVCELMLELSIMLSSFIYSYECESWKKFFYAIQMQTFHVLVDKKPHDKQNFDIRLRAQML